MLQHPWQQEYVICCLQTLDHDRYTSVIARSPLSQPTTSRRHDPGTWSTQVWHCSEHPAALLHSKHVLSQQWQLIPCRSACCLGSKTKAQTFNLHHTQYELHMYPWETKSHAVLHHDHIMFEWLLSTTVVILGSPHGANVQLPTTLRTNTVAKLWCRYMKCL